MQLLFCLVLCPSYSLLNNGSCLLNPDSDTSFVPDPLHFDNTIAMVGYIPTGVAPVDLYISLRFPESPTSRGEIVVLSSAPRHPTTSTSLCLVEIINFFNRCVLILMIYCCIAEQAIHQNTALALEIRSYATPSCSHRRPSWVG
jgi:hypothetical protein